MRHETAVVVCNAALVFAHADARGVVADRSATLRDQAERDHRDATRATAPLRQAAAQIPELAEALPLLRDVERQGRRLHELTAKIVQLEGQVDGLHDAGMRAAFQAQKIKSDPLAFMVSREIYKHLERVADAFEDVANEIDSLVIDHG